MEFVAAFLEGIGFIVVMALIIFGVELLIYIAAGDE